MGRQILHVDMDAFFAAVEQRDHPEYRGKPVIVGADPKQGKGRGVVSTCSYEARKFGIHSAMPIIQAWKRCPDGIYVPPNGKLYSQVSKEIQAIFFEFTDLVEPLSIDEAFLDVTGSIGLFKSGVEIARKIKQRILESQQLTASVGVAPNKFLSKIASDLEKPDGLVVVEEGKEKEFLAPLEISRLWGAGKKTVERLNGLGIHTIGDLQNLPEEVLKKKFGKMGRHFYLISRGIDDRNVVPDHGVKSVSNEMTFFEDVLDPEIIRRTLLRLAEKVAYRLRLQKLSGKTIHLKLRYEGFETHTRNRTIGNYTSNTQTIFNTVTQLFEESYQPGRRVRLLGVGVSQFGTEAGRQLSLFDAGEEKTDPLDELEDIVRNKFGKNAITRAGGLTNNPRNKPPANDDFKM